MYTREIQEPVDTPVENGLPVQGTWDRAFKEVNLRNIRRPYRFSLLNWTRDSRIKEWQSFKAQDEKFFFSARLANVKLFCIAHVHLYDKNTGKSYQYRKIIPGDNWHIPRSLANSSAGSSSPHFFLRVHNWLDADKINLDINIEAQGEQPALTVYLGYNMNRSFVTPMAVSLCFTETRSMYAFKAVAPVWGDIILGGKRFNMDPAKATGIFCDYKGYYPYRMRLTSAGAMDYTDNNRRFGFHLAENQAKISNRNNENALWINEHLCPLPPVRITMPQGIESDWVIQDVEGMVDLVFSPKVHKNNMMNSLLISSEYFAPLGQFNGMVANSTGEKIQVHNMWGMGENLLLRV